MAKLDFSKLDEPVVSKKTSQPAGQGAQPKSKPPVERWPSREPIQEGQFTVRAKLETIERFKTMCRPEGGGRFTYGEMLDKLMDIADRASK